MDCAWCWCNVAKHINRLSCFVLKTQRTAKLYYMGWGPWKKKTWYWNPTHTHTHPFNGPFPGLPGWAGTRKVKPIWILLKQETVSGSIISWATCTSASRSRQITMPVPHHSVLILKSYIHRKFFISCVISYTFDVLHTFCHPHLHLSRRTLTRKRTIVNSVA